MRGEPQGDWSRKKERRRRRRRRRRRSKRGRRSRMKKKTRNDELARERTEAYSFISASKVLLPLLSLCKCF